MCEEITHPRSETPRGGQAVGALVRTHTKKNVNGYNSLNRATQQNCANDSPARSSTYKITPTVAADSIDKAINQVKDPDQASQNAVRVALQLGSIVEEQGDSAHVHTHAEKCANGSTPRTDHLRIVYRSSIIYISLTDRRQIIHKPSTDHLHIIYRSFPHDLDIQDR